MSPPPWTLFWPRSGLRPEPNRPTWPQSRARLISERTLSTALWCSVIPSVQQIIARSARANACAVSRITSAGTPVSRSPSASVNGSTEAAYASKPSVALSMNVRFASPAWMISRAIVFDSAMSEPTSSPSQRSAHCAERRPAWIDDEEPGAVVDALEQVVEEDRMRLARVRAPEEDHVRLLDLCVGRRAAACSEHRRQTDDARRVSGSVTGVDVVRAHHLARELLRQEVHLVRRLGAREDPERRRRVGLPGARRMPAAARSSASSHVAGRSTPPSRTSGVVSRPLTLRMRFLLLRRTGSHLPAGSVRHPAGSLAGCRASK